MGNVSSPSSAHVSGSKKKKVDSPAASKKTAVITSAAAAPDPVVAPTPVLAPVVEPAEKKKADISAEALNVAGAPVHSEDDSSESEQSDEESEEESEEEEEEEEAKVEEEREVAVRFGIARGKVDQVPVSCNYICILFCIRVIVM